MSSSKNSSKSTSNKDIKSTKNISKKNKDLEKTNSYDLVFDDERMKDSESLDVSFIDGKKKKAPKIDMTEYKYETVDEVLEPKKGKSDVFSTILIMVLSFVLGMLVLYILVRDDLKKDVGSFTNTTSEVEEKIIIADNYVFLGDSIIHNYNLENFYPDKNVVNSGVLGDKTTDILENLKERVYQYNPSKVFLLIGANDIKDEVASEEIVSNIEKIVNSIITNRPYAEIYVQSIYPVNNIDDFDAEFDGVDKINNTDIMNINKAIENMCQKKNITYIDIYSKLIDTENMLNSSYTEDGLHLNDEGYKIVTSELVKYTGNK